MWLKMTLIMGKGGRGVMGGSLCLQGLKGADSTQEKQGDDQDKVTGCLSRWPGSLLGARKSP